jgi:hypothetical protein
VIPIPPGICKYLVPTQRGDGGRRGPGRGYPWVAGFLAGGCMYTPTPQKIFAVFEPTPVPPSSRPPVIRSPHKRKRARARRPPPYNPAPLHPKPPKPYSPDRRAISFIRRMSSRFPPAARTPASNDARILPWKSRANCSMDRMVIPPTVRGSTLLYPPRVAAQTKNGSSNLGAPSIGSSSLGFAGGSARSTSARSTSARQLVWSQDQS